MMPQPGEFAPFYQYYINQVPEGNIIANMKESLGNTLSLLSVLPEEKWLHRYAEGKWSIKEVLLHIIDTERVFAYRALGVARHDQTSFPGFDQDAYVPESRADARSTKSLLSEFAAVREASIQLFSHLDDDLWARKGLANNHPVSVRALAYIIVGHELHHINIIKERYL